MVRQLNISINNMTETLNVYPTKYVADSLLVQVRVNCRLRNNDL